MKKHLMIAAAGALTLGVAGQAAQAGTQTVSIDLEEWAPTEFFSFGDPTSNPNVTLDLGGGLPVDITGYALDFEVVAAGDAWMNEFGLGLFDSADVPDGSGLIISAPDEPPFTAPGTVDFDTEGMVTLEDAFEVTTGILYIEAFDFDPNFPGLTANGTVTLQYNVIPAPGALALIGLAGLAGRRRRHQ